VLQSYGSVRLFELLDGVLGGLVNVPGREIDWKGSIPFTFFLTNMLRVMMGSDMVVNMSFKYRIESA
jgi:hypothetical protein